MFLVMQEQKLSDSTVKVTSNVLYAEVGMITDSEQFLSPGQSYNVILELSMPESEVNYQAGTFMISLNFYDKVCAMFIVIIAVRNI